MKGILNYIFPARCLSCSSYIEDGASFCSSCWNKFHFIKEPHCDICSYQFENVYTIINQTCLGCRKDRPKYDYARCLFKYDESSKKLIHNLKYYDKTILAKPIAQMLVSRYRDEIEMADLIMPVPMNKLKRIKRLYNHSQIIAENVGSILRKKVRSDILIKIKHTKPQTGLNKSQRMRNLVGAFKVQNASSIKDKRILLVDDVITTSSTASLCARLLKKSGAKEVIMLCIARRML